MNAYICFNIIQDIIYQILFKNIEKQNSSRVFNIAKKLTKIEIFKILTKIEIFKILSKKFAIFNC